MFDCCSSAITLKYFGKSFHYSVVCHGAKLKKITSLSCHAICSLEFRTRVCFFRKQWHTNDWMSNTCHMNLFCSKSFSSATEFYISWFSALRKPPDNPHTILEKHKWLNGKLLNWQKCPKYSLFETSVLRVRNWCKHGKFYLWNNQILLVLISKTFCVISGTEFCYFLFVKSNKRFVLVEFITFLYA